MPSTTISRGNIINTKLFAVSMTPSQVAPNTSAEQVFTIIGVQPGDYINCQLGAAQTAGIFIANVRVTAINTVSMQFANITAGALTPVSGTYGFIWGRPENLPLDSNAT